MLFIAMSFSVAIYRNGGRQHYIIFYIKNKSVYSLKNSNIFKTSLLDFSKGMVFWAGIRPFISQVKIHQAAYF